MVDYTMLSMVQNGIVEKQTMKNVTSAINNYVRKPGAALVASLLLHDAYNGHNIDYLDNRKFYSNILLSFMVYYKYATSRTKSIIKSKWKYYQKHIRRKLPTSIQDYMDEREMLHNMLDKLFDDYSENTYVSGRLSNYIQNILPSYLENADKTHMEREKRKAELDTASDAFINTFLLFDT